MARTLTKQWPEERIERLKELWADPRKLSGAKIAAELGITRNAAIGMAYRLGLPSRENEGQASAWSAEEIALLEQLWNAPERYSEKVIADRLGKTRGAVCNKSRQLGLPRRERPTRKVSTMITADGQIIQFPIKRKMPERTSNAQIFAERYPASKVGVTPLHIDFMQLNDSVCKFECSGQDDPRLFTFCGHPSRSDRPYCSAHCRVAYEPMPDRGRKPVLELGRARGGIFGRVA